MSTTPLNVCKHGFKTGKDVGVSMLDSRYPLGLLVRAVVE